MNLRTSMLEHMNRTGKSGAHAVLATYRAYQNHLNYDFFRAQMVKAGIAVPKTVEVLENQCAEKYRALTVPDMVADYIGRTSAFERKDLEKHLIKERGGIDRCYLKKVINNFKKSGTIEGLGNGVYLSRVAA